jgi:hypothetical protein
VSWEVKPASRQVQAIPSTEVHTLHTRTDGYQTRTSQRHTLHSLFDAGRSPSRDGSRFRPGDSIGRSPSRGISQIDRPNGDQPRTASRNAHHQLGTRSAEDLLVVGDRRPDKRREVLDRCRRHCCFRSSDPQKQRPAAPQNQYDHSGYHRDQPPRSKGRRWQRPDWTYKTIADNKRPLLDLIPCNRIDRQDEELCVVPNLGLHVTSHR